MDTPNTPSKQAFKSFQFVLDYAVNIGADLAHLVTSVGIPLLYSYDTNGHPKGFTVNGLWAIEGTELFTRREMLAVFQYNRQLYQHADQTSLARYDNTTKALGAHFRVLAFAFEEDAEADDTAAQSGGEETFWVGGLLVWRAPKPPIPNTNAISVQEFQKEFADRGGFMFVLKPLPEQEALLSLAMSRVSIEPTEDPVPDDTDRTD